MDELFEYSSQWALPCVYQQEMASALAMPVHQALLNPAGILLICPLTNQNDLSSSVGFGNPCLPLISHSGGS